VNELDELLANKDFMDGQLPRVVELFLDYNDAPQSVKLASTAVEEYNKRK
jgi:pyruvate decarboxylase